MRKLKGGCSIQDKNVSAKIIYCCVFNKISGTQKNAAYIQQTVRRSFAVVKSSYIFHTFERRQRLWPGHKRFTVKGYT